MAGPESLTLLCFAVPQEAKPVLRWAKGREDLRILVTGMGTANASNAVRSALTQHRRPSKVVTCGYAGLVTGDAVFSTEVPLLGEACEAAGAKPGRFVCMPRVVTTAREKSSLRNQTGADAVEMESQSIAEVCRSEGVPCVILRVILDSAGEDLPLDFNALVDKNHRLSVVRLALELAKSPGKIAGLLRLRRQTVVAAEKLSRILRVVIGST
jgi:nucleoside phosphorylase